MKIVTFEVPTQAGAVRRLGALQGHDGGTIVDLNAAFVAALVHGGDEPTPIAYAELRMPPEMIGWLKAGHHGIEAARRAISFSNDHPGASGANGESLIYRRQEVRLLAPLPRPTAFRDFSIYEQHMTKGDGAKFVKGPDWYVTPPYYKGSCTSIAGPEDIVPWPYYTQRLDLEIELGIIIGRHGRNLSFEEAGQCIAGYTILVDSSCRDGYTREPFGPNKRKDFHTALGPAMITTEGIDPENLTCSVSVDGEIWFEGSTADPHSFSPAQLVAYASELEVVEPGDLIGTGTIGYGCSMDIGKWVRPGQQVTFKIEKIGEMTLTIGEVVHGKGHVNGMVGQLRAPTT